MIAAFAGFLMGFIGSMPVTGPTSLLVLQRGMLARYRDGWAIGLGGGPRRGGLLRHSRPWLQHPTGTPPSL